MNIKLITTTLLFSVLLTPQISSAHFSKKAEKTPVETATKIVVPKKEIRKAPEAKTTDINAVQRAARAGSAVDAYILGNAFFYGQNGKEQDDRLAKRWLEIAAKRGNACANHNLAYVHLWGRSVERSVEKGILYLKKGGRAGCPKSFYDLGYMYQWGIEVEKNIAKAMNYYERAIENGSTDAMANYAGLILKNDAMADEHAVLLYSLLYDAGETYIASDLAYLYFTGTGTEKHVEMAVYILEQAAQKNDAGSIFALAMLYELGEGVQKNAELSAKLYREAMYQFERMAREESLEGSILTHAFYKYFFGK